ncbi:MAG: GNAT family N-acetyltransferase [Dethiobacteria bacterium]|jgi:acyl-CoA hydrolase/RimJ/RimL family protein N-acetyltransferase
MDVQPDSGERKVSLEGIKLKYPEKFAPEKEIFKNIHAGNRIFIGSGCGEPQHLLQTLISYVESEPKAFLDAEILQVWTFGVVPYASPKFKHNFRLNTFFIERIARETVNKGMADYTPVFASEIPALFNRKLVQVDVALVQTTLPDEHGYLSLGISVDIVKAAVENAALVIAQVNAHMPRVHGDTFVHVQDVDYLIHHDEPLLEYEARGGDDVAWRIGNHVSQLIEDGDTIQVGYGNIPNAILKRLENKKHLGVHTELLNDGIVDLIKKGVIDNSCKNIDRGKTVATFCMGKKSTYDFLHDNPSVAFRAIDYTNNPAVIARNKNMVAINSALEIDLTGQASAESLGKRFMSGIGGQADFMRGAVLAQGGKTILALPSTAKEGRVSRIVPLLQEGAGVTLTRGDIHYVITEYGIAYLFGKNVRERAMSLIAIAHPDFRPGLIAAAKELLFIYPDQAFIPGKGGVYPGELETYRTTKDGFTFQLRPVKISDEPLVKNFIYSLSEETMHKRFITRRRDMPHEILQDLFVVIDYTKEMVILALLQEKNREKVIGVGQYVISEGHRTAEVSLVIRDDYQNMGIGSEIMSYMANLAKKQGVLGFTALVLPNNVQILRVLEKAGFDMEKWFSEGVYLVKVAFREK